MKIRSLGALATCILFSGCIPSQQIHFTRRPHDHDLRISPGYGRPLALSIKTPTLDWTKQGEVNSALSYAKDSRGNQYAVLAVANEYARNYPERSYFTSHDLYLVNPRDKNKTLPGWRNGRWNLHLVLDSPRGRSTMDAGFVLSNFTFILFVHRPN